MKVQNLFLSTVVAVSTMYAGSVAIAAGQATWNCTSDKDGVSAVYVSSMVVETITLTVNGIETLYFNEGKTAPPRRMFLEDDPDEGDLQKKDKSFSKELVEEPAGDDGQLKFEFRGSKFSCTRS